MKRDNDRQTAIILSIVGIVPVIWLALLIAPSISGGLPEIAANLAILFDNPFSIKLCGDSLKTVLILLLCYGMGIGIYFSTRKNYRRREEHGSAKWGNVRAIDKKYRQKPLSENKLMTQNVCIGLNAKKHRRNLNTLVCGGSGAGKTRFYAKPNIMNAARNSYVILDPKGENNNIDFSAHFLLPFHIVSLRWSQISAILRIPQLDTLHEIRSISTTEGIRTNLMELKTLNILSSVEFRN